LALAGDRSGDARREEGHEGGRGHEEKERQQNPPRAAGWSRLAGCVGHGAPPVSLITTDDAEPNASVCNKLATEDEQFADHIDKLR
jgi:hypothetical protein